MYFAFLHLVRVPPASGRQRRVPLPSRRRWRDGAHRLSIGPRGHNDTSCPPSANRGRAAFFTKSLWLCLCVWISGAVSLDKACLAEHWEANTHTHTNTQTEGLVSRGNSAPLIPWAFSQINHPFPSVTPLPRSTLSLTKHTHTEKDKHSLTLLEGLLTNSKSLSQLYLSRTGLSVAGGHEAQVRTVV